MVYILQDSKTQKYLSLACTINAEFEFNWTGLGDYAMRLIHKEQALLVRQLAADILNTDAKHINLIQI